MSSSEYYLFGLDGSELETKEARNGHGSASVIWGKLCEKYFGSSHAWLTSDYKDGPLAKLFSRANANDLPEDERVCLLLTADRIVLLREYFTRAADALNRFLAGYPTNYVNHWPEIAAWLRESANREDVLGFGVYSTSVSENPWCKFDPEAEEYVWVDARTVESLPFETASAALDGFEV